MDLPTPTQRRQLGELCALCGLVMDDAVVESLVQLLAAGVQPAAVMKALIAAKDKKVEEEAARRRGAGAAGGV